MKKHFCPYCMAPVEEGEPCGACGLTSGTYSPSPHHLPPGTILMERYLVGRVLGEGGFGITYIGCDLRLELKVAIKEYFPSDKVTRHAQASLEVSNYTGAMAGNYEQGKEKYLQEARTMARMNKQAEIVSVRDFFEANNTAYIVMEYVEGTTFKELVAQKGGRIPAGEFLHMIEPLFFALNVMHETGLIHRDISPDNLMLENGSVRLLDFGCARESTHGTETMTIALKHGYAPIEQYQHKGQGPWTDVYGLCATMYYCLTGKVPQQSLDRLCEDELILPRKLGVDLTENQERALLYGMGIRPRRRYQSIQELYAALYTGVPAPKIETGQNFMFGSEIGQAPPVKEPESVRPADESDHMAEMAEKATDDQTKVQEVSDISGDCRIKEEKKTSSELAEVQESVEETAEEEHDPEDNPDEKQIDTKQKKAASKIGIAAVAAAIVCLVSSPFLLQEKLRPVSNTNPEEEQPAVLSELTTEEIFEGAAIVGTSSEAALRAALESNAKAVVWNNEDSIQLTGETLILNKPLYIGEMAHLEIDTQVIVESGGGIYIAGVLDNNGFLQVKEDGLVRIEEGGFLGGASSILVEKEENLVVENGGTAEICGENFSKTGFDRLNYVVFSEESIFADAVHVRTGQQLKDALDYGNVSSIIIDEDITLEEPFRYMDKSVMVSEGVTVTAPQEAEASLCFDGWYFVNHGTISGCFQVGDWNEDGRPSYVINYGQISDRIFVESVCNFVNAGQMTLSGWMKEARLYNLGEIVHDNNSDDTWLEFLDMWLTNLGTIHVEGDTEQDARAEIKFAAGVEVLNFGVIELSGKSWMANEAYVHGYGEIFVTEISGDMAEVWNNGIIRLNYAPASRKAAAFNIPTGVNFDNEGLIMYSVHSSFNIPEREGGYNGGFMPFEWGDDTGNISYASNVEELRYALENEACDLIIIDVEDEIILDRELVVTKGLVTTWRTDLHFTEGGLTLEGKDAYFYNDGRLLMNGNGITILDGAVLYVTRMEECGDLYAGNEGKIILQYNEENAFAADHPITLEDGGRILSAAYSSKLENKTVSIGQNCIFRMLNRYSTIIGTDIEIREGGELLMNIRDSRIDENSVITNNGKLALESSDECILNGEITSNNSMECYACTNIDGGKLINNGNLRIDIGDQSFTGDGSIENNGTILSPHEEVLRNFRGSYEGNEIVYEEY